MSNKTSEGFYRNLNIIEGIDPGALWQRDGNSMVLVDEDQFIKVYYSPELFKPCEETELPPGFIH